MTPEDLKAAPVERRADDRRQVAQPVPEDRRRDERRAARLQPATSSAGVALIVDAWPLVRAGIRQLLEERAFRVAADGAAMSEVARAVGDRLDLVVIGTTNGSSADAVEYVRRLPRRSDGARPLILLLMEQVTAEELRELLTMGVEGVVQRSIGMDDLGAACDRLLAGHRVISGGPLSVLASSGLAVRDSPARAAAEEEVLTRKEREVLGHLAQHQSNREIAQRMHVSTATVKTHLSNIYSKLGVSSRREAVVESVQRGLLT